MDEMVKKTNKKPYNPADSLPDAGPGRPKGSKNKFTSLKDAYLEVFKKIEKEGENDKSEIKNLFKWATKNDRNQALFYQMIARMLPTNLESNVKADVIFTLNRIITEQKPDETNGLRNGD